MKVLKISVILPYYEARYVIGQRIEIKSNSGNTLTEIYEDEVVKEIIYMQTGFNVYSYVVITDKGKEIYISEEQIGLQIVKEKLYKENK